MDIIVAYGQQAEKSAKEKDDFYKQLDEMIKSTPKKHSLMIAGDLNFKVGQARTDTEKGIIGKFAVSNNTKKEAMGQGAIGNRERLINTCRETGLKLINAGSASQLHREPHTDH